MKFPAHNAGLYLTHNEHKNLYQTAADWLATQAAVGAAVEFVNEDERDKAIATDSIWQLQWYPDTPVGSYSLAASDLEVLLEAANSR